LEENFGLNVQATGYSYDIGGESLQSMTQDLEFMLLKDVIEFVTWLKDFLTICRITYNKWDVKKERMIFDRDVKNSCMKDTEG
jgi:hypothetical protein